MLSVALNIFTSLAVFQRGFGCPNQLSRVKTLMASKKGAETLRTKISNKIFFLERSNFNWICVARAGLELTC